MQYLFSYIMHRPSELALEGCRSGCGMTRTTRTICRLRQTRTCSDLYGNDGDTTTIMRGEILRSVDSHKICFFVIDLIFVYMYTVTLAGSHGILHTLYQHPLHLHPHLNTLRMQVHYQLALYTQVMTPSAIGAIRQADPRPALLVHHVQAPYECILGMW